MLGAGSGSGASVVPTALALHPDALSQCPSCPFCWDTLFLTRSVPSSLFSGQRADRGSISSLPWPSGCSTLGLGSLREWLPPPGNAFSYPLFWEALSACNQEACCSVLSRLPTLVEKIRSVQGGMAVDANPFSFEKPVPLASLSQCWAWWLFPH